MKVIPAGAEIRPSTRDEVLPLFVAHHGYKSLGASMTYCYAVYEADVPVAAFAWQPPPPGAAKSVCVEMPSGVLALSRMVALPRAERQLRHISKPLRRQMMHLIDRTRWPVLVTYSDEGQGHTGHVYKCSGWQPTTRRRQPIRETADGARASSYSNGKHGGRALVNTGHTWIQRWEHWACEHGRAADWMASHGWRRIALTGRVWASGQQAYTYTRVT
jgi:hypothetical protein